jgi:hypothetical protein
MTIRSCAASAVLSFITVFLISGPGVSIRVGAQSQSAGAKRPMNFLFQLRKGNR